VHYVFCGFMLRHYDVIVYARENHVEEDQRGQQEIYNASSLGFQYFQCPEPVMFVTLFSTVLWDARSAGRTAFTTSRVIKPTPADITRNSGVDIPFLQRRIFIKKFTLTTSQKKKKRDFYPASYHDALLPALTALNVLLPITPAEFTMTGRSVCHVNNARTAIKPEIIIASGVAMPLSLLRISASF